MSVKSLLIKAPGLCDATNRRKHSEVADAVWMRESEGKGFQRVVGESAMDRVSFLFDWPCANNEKREYCKNLAALAVASHYAIEHGCVESMAEAKGYEESLVKLEPRYPDVASELTVSAAASGIWF